MATVGRLCLSVLCFALCWGAVEHFAGTLSASQQLGVLMPAVAFGWALDLLWKKW